MSCVTSWKNVKIQSFNPDAIKVNSEMVAELNRLQKKFDDMHSQYLRSSNSDDDDNSDNSDNNNNDNNDNNDDDDNL